MIRETFPVGLLGCNCTILGDETSHEAIVVDPGYEIPRILATLARHGLTVKRVVVTHAHIDHIASALELKRLTGAPILYNVLDLPLVALLGEQAAWLGLDTPEVEPPDDDLAHGKSVAIDGVVASVLHTRGHTQGSICLYLPAESLLIAGDTLFAGSVGRTDLPGGNSDQLLRSIHEHLLSLPDDTAVIAGHGAGTTIGQERRRNPWLRGL
jgi:hydroxyacylglutathione hydrolase